MECVYQTKTFLILGAVLGIIVSLAHKDSLVLGL